MKKLLAIVAIVLCFLFCGGLTAYADYEEENDCTFLETVSSQGHEHCYNDTDTHADREDPIGVGADVLIVEGKKLDLVAEYKYDFENEEHSVFGVFKTKVALWDIIKGFFKRGE